MASSSDSVRVSFFTQRFDVAMPDTIYTVPIRILPAGLSELVNSVLGLHPQVPMDFFLPGGEILRSTVESYIKQNSDQRSAEDVLVMEYAPSITYVVKQSLPHSDWVTSVKTVSYEESFLLSGCYDTTIRLWSLDQVDSQEPECISIGQGHSTVVKEVCLMSIPSVSSATKPNGKKRFLRASVSNLRCASASKDSVFVWTYHSDVSKFEKEHEFRFHSEAIETVDYQHTLRLLASGGWDESIYLWNPDAEKKDAAAVSNCVLKGHTRCVTRVRFPAALAENNATLLSTSLDGTLRVWDVSGHVADPIRTFSTGHAAYGLAVRGTNEAATGHTDGKLRLWDSRKPQCATHTFKGHQKWIYSIAYSAEHHVVTSSEDCTVRLWDTRILNGSMVLMDTQHGDGVLDITPCGPNTIATASKDNTVKITATTNAPAQCVR